VRCEYDPGELAGQPIGMLHCAECGCMILAGVPHRICDPDECLLYIDEDDDLREVAAGE